MIIYSPFCDFVFAVSFLLPMKKESLPKALMSVFFIFSVKDLLGLNLQYFLFMVFASHCSKLSEDEEEIQG